MTDPRHPGLPPREEILRFIRESPGAVDKREIARAFRLKGDARLQLKALLRELEEEGALERNRGKRLSPPGALPEVTVVEIIGTDADGEALARPLSWPHDEPPPRIYLLEERRGMAAPAAGDRVLAQLRRSPDGTYFGRAMRRLEGAAEARILGIYEDTSEGPRLRPTDRRQKADFVVLPNESDGAVHGELVLAELMPATRLGLRRARVIERLGDSAEPRAISLIAIHGNDIPTLFPPSAVEQAERAAPPALGSRTDLRRVPLVTIDGADARDFDDAVWAEPDADVPGGWRLLVAIADVASYVRPGSPLDRAAFERGNSVYFPDRVVPMLPEALSNGLCSLKPGEDRACIAVELLVDAGGELTGHRFLRGLMRSAARLTYEQVQEALDGRPDDATGPLMEPVLRPLYGAYQALAAARRRRGTLELDLPERKVRLDERGRVAEIAPRERLDSHRLIEEFMICANVAAAEALEARGAPCLYRVHDQPSEEKLEALREFLGSLGQPLAKGVLRAADLARTLDRFKGRPEADMVSEVMLRSQAQAAYAPENIGHFGLALRRYAHFTSPIRRYADLIVHRSLIRAYALGEGGGEDGLTENEAARLDEIGTHVSATERRAAAAEQDAAARYAASWLAERIGSVMEGRISGATRFGLFVRVDSAGVEGFVPASTLPDDRYEHDPAAHALVGARWGRVFRLGARVRVRVEEADPLTASTLFALLEPDGADLPGLPAPRPGTRPGARADRPGRGGRSARRRV
ncbi:ribonuclease R [Arenibaculum pallidiluteum]|uniref:ribonuclease R n=1 Tax=Arenibaculum pallidiluteum TaxID=2812559 RepID=UPI001A95CF0C|nr:ribonuclease R [Arenibaculum pallidiluteum]